MELPEHIKQKINETMFMNGGNTTAEKGFYRLGAITGYSLANEEIEWLQRKKQTIFDLGMASRKWHHKKIAELQQEIKERDETIESLKTVMVAAAEEINLHWDAHCDSEGYGPSSLLRRLEQGIPASYGYTAGRFEEMKKEIERLKGLIKHLYIMYNREVMFPDKLEKQYEQFKTENNL